MIEKAYRLDGKTAIVVGAGNGIGRAISLAFAAGGAKVGCLDVEEASASATVAAIARQDDTGIAIAVGCDVTSEASVAAAVAEVVQRLGTPQVLVNGAAVHDPSGTIVEVTPEWWSRVLAVNLTGAFLVSRAVIPLMAAAGGGSIIHIASQMGRVGAPGRAAYTATKGALIQLAKTMALDHAHQRIRVNSLSPGAVETRRLEHRWGDMATARSKSVPLHPLGRLGQPDEIALAALYLASDASAFMTGSDLLIDGGYTAI